MLTATPSIGHEASPRLTSRRHVLLGLGAALVGAPLLARAQPVSPVGRGTPTMTLGPFYPLDRLDDADADLTRVAGRDDVAHGVPMVLEGRVLTLQGVPVAGAVLDVWQTNGYGRYHHPSDPSRAPLDPAFQGAAVIRTDGEGRYRLRSVMPLPYDTRQRHLHFDIRGQRRRLVTQMMFPGEPNELDGPWSSISSPAAREAAVAREAPPEGGVRRFTWDIVLAGE